MIENLPLEANQFHFVRCLPSTTVKNLALVRLICLPNEQTLTIHEVQPSISAVN